MNQVVYWNAPLWQIIIATLTLITAFTLQQWMIWRKPTLREAIHNTDKNLATFPLFFFSEWGGLLPLNDAAHHFLERNNVQKNNHMRLLMTLLKQSLNANHIIFRNGTDKASLSLVTIPHFNPKAKQGGVLAAITEHTIPFMTYDGEVDDTMLTHNALHDWVQIDDNLMVYLLGHNIQIRRDDVWVNKQLSHLQYELLRYLIQNVGQSVSYQDVFKQLWLDEQIEPLGLTQHQQEKLRTQIYQLRQLIEHDPSKPQKLNTIRNYGVTFQAKIQSMGGIDD